jgi:hypothetical protein
MSVPRESAHVALRELWRNRRQAHLERRRIVGSDDYHQ